jgi:hypothetical protein
LQAGKTWEKFGSISEIERIKLLVFVIVKPESNIEDSVPRDKEVLDSNRAAHEVLVGVKMAHSFLT